MNDVSSVAPPADTLTADPAIRAAWGRHGLLFAALIALQIALLWETWASLIQVWSQSATFNHCFLILPIVGWLIWQRRQVFTTIMPGTSLAGVLLLVPPALLWSLGHLAGIKLFEHVAVVALLQVSVLIAFGWPGLKALLFPVFYLVFLAPLGDQLTKPLQDLTAQFSVWTLLKLDIPTFSDGVFIQIPTGNFEVAEACAGVRFLIATLALGALYANIAFKSWRRRAVVMALCFIVPIVANAIRAVGIILIAHYSNAKYAVGVDHIVYGWGFFAFVTIVLLFIGQRFADRPLSEAIFDGSALARANRPAVAPRRLVLGVGFGMLVLLASWGFNRHVDTRPPERIVAAVRAPQIAGWSLTSAARLDWEPVYPDADKRAHFVYLSPAGRVDVAIVTYNREDRARELISGDKGVVPPQSEDATIVQWRWMMALPGPVIDGASLPANGMVIRQMGDTRDVWQWYLTGDRFVASPSRAKLNALIAKAGGGDLLAATLIVTSPRLDDVQDQRQVMQAFLTAAGGPEALLRRALALSSGQAR